MSSKLQNIKAVKQMLEGSHKTQTRKNFSLATANSTAEKNKKRIPKRDTIKVAILKLLYSSRII